MNFQATLYTGSAGPVNPSYKIINAPSWSACLAYCEGTGENISQLSYLTNAEVVVNDETSTNCFQVSLRSNTTMLLTSYMVFDTSYDTLQTWINSQTNKSVANINVQQKTYVVF